jgi:GntR family transcriptional regulator, transcriptional repressor for pyruvate dehydrogenase complex
MRGTFSCPRSYHGLMNARPEPATPARSQTDVVVDGIKTMITGGALRAGSRLPIEKDLALELGVSRSSLREGVRALAIMGVLETRQGDGTYVTSLDPSLLLAPMSFLVDLHTDADASYLQSVRRVLETEAAGRAAMTIDDDALTEAERHLARVDELLLAQGQPDAEAFMEADIAFHRVVSHASGNPALEALIEALATRTIRGRMWRAITEDGAMDATHAEHRAIFRALQAHDPDSARLRMGTHLLAVQDFMHDHPAEGRDADQPTATGTSAARAAAQ